MRARRAGRLPPAEPPGTGITGWLDGPVDGRHPADRPVEVHGWVVPPSAVDRIEVGVTAGDRTWVELARPFCTVRDDLVDHLDDPSAVLAGFEHRLHLRGIPPGTDVVVRVAGVGAGGRVALGRPARLVVTQATRAGSTGSQRPPRRRRAIEARAAGAADARVLVVAHDLAVGGAQRWLQEVLRHLAATPGVTPVVVGPGVGPLRDELRSLGIRVHAGGPPARTVEEHEARIAELVALVHEERADVVLVNTVVGVAGVEAAERCGLPSVLAVHEHHAIEDLWSVVLGPDHDPAVAAVMTGAIGRATVAVFVADATRRLYAPLVDPRRAAHLDYGIRLDDVDRARAAADRAGARRALGLAPDDVVLLDVATVEPRKAQSSLVVAFERVAAARPDARLVLVGADHLPYAAAVGCLAAASDLGDRVRLAGPSDDVDLWYVAADGVVVASDAESLPRTLIEGMAHGLPVVATDVGGITGLVEDGVTGWICPPRDLGALADRLGRFLDVPAGRRAAMGARAAASVRPSRGVGYAADIERLLVTLVADPDAAIGSLPGRSSTSTP